MQLLQLQQSDIYFVSCLGSATLFYIVKGRDRSKFATLLRNHIIHTLLNGMEMHLTDDTMLRNGYLTLTQFHMPVDVVGRSICYTFAYPSIIGGTFTNPLILLPFAAV